MKQSPTNLVIAPVSHPINQSILGNSLVELDNIRKQAPDWGSPELLMPFFEEVMYKSHQSFDKIMPQLFAYRIHRLVVEVQREILQSSVYHTKGCLQRLAHQISGSFAQMVSRGPTE